MTCPKCRDTKLSEVQLDEQFSARSCGKCGGHWILVDDFVQWRAAHPEYAFADDVDIQEDDIADTTNALLCPMTGTFMRKFRMSAQTAHRIDYSSAVGGVWLDKGEWELLKKEGLADSMNELLTNSWQQKVREFNSQEHFARIYQDKFGDVDYEKLKVFRQWLDSHALKADMRAYLLAEDPYSADR